MPAVWLRETGSHAYGRVSISLRMYDMQNAAAPETRGLLRILLVWIGQLPADSGSPELLVDAGIRKTLATIRGTRGAV